MEIAVVRHGNADKFGNKIPNDYFQKDNCSILEGNTQIVLNSGSTSYISTGDLEYPEGFNGNNCIVLAVGETTSTDIGYYYGTTNSTQDYAAGAVSSRIQLGINKISYRFLFNTGVQATETQSKTIYFKIILLKIK